MKRGAKPRYPEIYKEIEGLKEGQTLIIDQTRIPDIMEMYEAVKIIRGFMGQQSYRDQYTTRTEGYASGDQITLYIKKL